MASDIDDTNSSSPDLNCFPHEVSALLAGVPARWNTLRGGRGHAETGT